MGIRRKILPRQEAMHMECIRRSTQMNALVNELNQLRRAQQDQLQQFVLNSAEGSMAARQKFTVSFLNQIQINYL